MGRGEEGGPGVHAGAAQTLLSPPRPTLEPRGRRPGRGVGCAHISFLIFAASRTVGSGPRMPCRQLGGSCPGNWPHLIDHEARAECKQGGGGRSHRLVQQPVLRVRMGCVEPAGRRGGSRLWRTKLKLSQSPSQRPTNEKKWPHSPSSLDRCRTCMEQWRAGGCRQAWLGRQRWQHRWRATHVDPAPDVTLPPMVTTVTGSPASECRNSGCRQVQAGAGRCRRAQWQLRMPRQSSP